MPSDRHTSPAAQAQIPHATTLRPSAARIVRLPIGEASSSIVSRRSLRPRLRCSRRRARPLLHVRDGRERRRAPGFRAGRSPPIAIRATHAAPPTKGSDTTSADDERDHVARAVAEDRAEGAARRDLGGGREPSGPEQVADPKGKDVVRPEPAEHERVEASHGELERARRSAATAPPARCRQTGSPPLRAARARRRRRGARARRRRGRRRGRRARGRTPTMRVRLRAARPAASACPEPFAAQAFAAQTRGIE